MRSATRCSNRPGGASVKIYYEVYGRERTNEGMGARVGVESSGLVVSRRNRASVRMLETVSLSAWWRVAASMPTQVQSAATDKAKAIRPCLVIANIRRFIAEGFANQSPVAHSLKTKSFRCYLL